MYRLTAAEAEWSFDWTVDRDRGVHGLEMLPLFENRFSKIVVDTAIWSSIQEKLKMDCKAKERDARHCSTLLYCFRDGI